MALRSTGLGIRSNISSPRVARSIGSTPIDGFASSIQQMTDNAAAPDNVVETFATVLAVLLPDTYEQQVLRAPVGTLIPDNGSNSDVIRLCRIIYHDMTCSFLQMPVVLGAEARGHDQSLIDMHESLGKVCYPRNADLEIPSPGDIIMINYMDTGQYQGGFYVQHFIATPNPGSAASSDLSSLIAAVGSGTTTALQDYSESGITSAATEQLLNIGGDSIFPYVSEGVTNVDIIVFYHGIEPDKSNSQRQATVLNAIETYVKPTLPSDKLFIVPSGHNKDFDDVLDNIETFRQQKNVTIRSISLGFWSGGATGGTKALNSDTRFNKIVAADPSTANGLSGADISSWQDSTQTASSFNMYYRKGNWPTDPTAYYLRDYDEYVALITAAGGTLVETDEGGYNHFDIMVHSLKELAS